MQFFKLWEAACINIICPHRWWKIILCTNSYSASHDNWCTVGGDGGCRVGEVRAGTTSPMPDHKGLKLEYLVNFQKYITLRANTRVHVCDTGVRNQYQGQTWSSLPSMHVVKGGSYRGSGSFFMNTYSQWDNVLCTRKWVQHLTFLKPDQRQMVRIWTYKILFNSNTYNCGESNHWLIYTHASHYVNTVTMIVCYGS